MKLSNYVLDFIAKLGVKHVFFLPGGAAMHLNDSLGRQPGIQAVCNLHEQGAAIAAEAYAKVSEGFGVAMVTAGPGSTNAVTGVASAYLDSIPVIFLSGQVKSADLKRNSGLRQLGVQEIDIVSIVGSITKYAVTIDDPSMVRYHLERGIYEATHGRQGPVWFDFPLDVQAADIDPEELAGFTPPPAPDTTAGLHRAASECIAMLNASERPVLVVGNGIRQAGAIPLFLELVELLQMPVLPTWLGLDLIPADHPLCLGRPGGMAPRGANFCMQNSDLLLSLGARLDMAMTGYSHPNLARGARKIVVDIDPAEVAKFQTHIDLPVVADVKDFLEEMLRQRDSIVRRDRSPWRSRCDEWKARYSLSRDQPPVTPGALSMYHFAEALSDAMEEGEVVAGSSAGFASEIFFMTVSPKKNQRIFHSRGMGAMGFGLPASIGASFASAGRRVICLEADGGFQMNVQELAVIAEHRLPIKMFVVNNRGYASIRASQANYFKLLTGCDETSGLKLPDLQALAKAYGLPAVGLDHRDDLRGKIREVLAMDGPALCEVVVAPDEPRIPRLASSQRKDGTMVSRPLEDLFPFLDREEFQQNMIVPPIPE